MLYEGCSVGSYVHNILVSYLDWEKLKEQVGYDELPRDKKNELRFEYDNDAKYYYEVMKLPKERALFADTVISFWMPYKRLLQCKAGWSAYKTVKSLERLLKQTNANWQNNYTAKIDEVNHIFEDFAQICCSKGNYMLLPARQMNSERACDEIEDRIDLTLYECFENGKLARFFETKDILKNWIEEQKLSSIFINGEICRDKINWFVEEKRPISKMGEGEVCEYLRRAILLIQERNK